MPTMRLRSGYTAPTQLAVGGRPRRRRLWRHDLTIAPGSASHRLGYCVRMAGDIDPLGTRKDGLDSFLDERVAEGFAVETRTDTHAIIARRPKGLRRFTSGDDPGRYVVEVNEDGVATMRPAEPRRS